MLAEPFFEGLMKSLDLSLSLRVAQGAIILDDRASSLSRLWCHKALGSKDAPDRGKGRCLLVFLLKVIGNRGSSSIEFFGQKATSRCGDL